MKTLKALMVAGLLVAASFTANAQSWGVNTPMGSFGSSSGPGGQSWGFATASGVGFSYSSGGGGGYCGGGNNWGGSPSGAVFYPNTAPAGVYGGYGPGPSRGYVRRSAPTAYTSGWVAYPNAW